MPGEPTYEQLQERLRTLERELAESRSAGGTIDRSVTDPGMDGAAAQAHELLKNLARLVPGVIYQYRLFPDNRSCFPYSSPGMADIYEVTPEEVREDATPVFGRLHPEDIDRVSADIFESARTKRTFDCEFRVVLPRQGLRWRKCLAHPEPMPDGGTLWHGIITDITEQKQAEQENQELQKQLVQAQKMESVGRLAGGVAHDYNNMLSVIVGYTELAMEKVGPDAPAFSDLREIRKAARRSTEITRQLLAFSRQQAIAPRSLDLNHTVVTMLNMLRRLIDEGVELNWSPGADIWPVLIDPIQIDQILVNLCVNSRDAIAEAGTISITTDVKTFDSEYCANHDGFVAGDFVVLSVSDDGCGMDQQTLEHVFEPFFTTKEVGRGTGMGLATVYGIVKQNKGFINVYSEPGQGTTIRIYLPRNHAPTDSSRRPALAGPDAGGHETILVVEDEPTIMKLTAAMLERLGYDVLTAVTTAAAIETAANHAGTIDLLVTDLVMPEMNGRELSQKFLAYRPGAGVLYVSGYTADVIAHRGVLEESVNFLQKPFSKQELAVAVRAALVAAQDSP